MLVNFTNVVPGGIVVFVPSYAFLNSVTSVWQSSKLLDRLRTKKKVFSEPKDSGEVESVLREYAVAIEQVCTIIV